MRELAFGKFVGHETSCSSTVTIFGGYSLVELSYYVSKLWTVGGPILFLPHVSDLYNLLSILERIQLIAMPAQTSSNV